MNITICTYFCHISHLFFVKYVSVFCPYIELVVFLLMSCKILIYKDKNVQSYRKYIITMHTNCIIFLERNIVYIHTYPERIFNLPICDLPFYFSNIFWKLYLWTLFLPHCLWSFQLHDPRNFSPYKSLCEPGFCQAESMLNNAYWARGYLSTAFLVTRCQINKNIYCHFGTWAPSREVVGSRSHNNIDFYSPLGSRWYIFPCDVYFPLLIDFIFFLSHSTVFSINLDAYLDSQLDFEFFNAETQFSAFSKHCKKKFWAPWTFSFSGILLDKSPTLT